MTVASEITRLQGAKSDIRQAIIDKGVDVGAGLTLDEYAACILAIESIKKGYIDFLIVGGGGGGGQGSAIGYGGGGGGTVMCQCFPIKEGQTYSISVGASVGPVADGKPSCAFGFVANGGQKGQSGCGASGNGCSQGQGGCSGGGGAGGAGNGGCGGKGICSDISGETKAYAGGGGGLGCPGCDGGGCGRGNNSSHNATYYGGGGAGAGWDGYNNGGNGYQGVVILRYKTDGSCGICNTSTGGTKYTCGDYTIHCFTNTGATEQFVPVLK